VEHLFARVRSVGGNQVAGVHVPGRDDAREGRDDLLESLQLRVALTAASFTWMLARAASICAAVTLTCARSWSIRSNAIAAPGPARSSRESVIFASS